MKTISAEKITGTVAALCRKANLELRPDVLSALQSAARRESNPRGRRCLLAVIENAREAKRKKLAICQDTGFPTVFIELGSDVRIAGDLAAAVNKGLEAGYREASFRRSIVQDPIRRGVSKFSPGIIHTDLVKGARMRITVMPKGFGCENKTRLKMLNPTADIREIEDFVVETVRAAGPDGCPPYIIGVGVGGTPDYACLIAKKALLRDIGRHGKQAGLEKELLKKINALSIGPMGLGGKTTALAVAVETFPTHIAGLPVAVSISCHALRGAAATL